MASSTGFTLGGSARAVGADEMRLARLARFSPAVGSVDVLPPQANIDVTPSAALLTEPVPSSSAPLAEPVASTPDSLPVVAGLPSMPDGALLRIAALVDLPSGLALTGVCSGPDETTVAAMSALRAAIGRAHDEHRATQQAIEAERQEAMQRMNGQQQAAAAALDILRPLQNGGLQNRLPDFANVLHMLEEDSAVGTISAELEAELAARLAAAASLVASREAQARAHVAEGELPAVALGSQSYLVAGVA